MSEKNELIDNLQDNIEDVQAQKKVEEANRDTLERAREDEDKLVETKIQLIEVQNKIKDIFMASLKILKRFLMKRKKKLVLHRLSLNRS